MAEDQDKTLLQQLAGVLADYGEWLGDMLGASAGEASGKNMALNALFDDLGLSYKTGSEHQFSVPPLAGIKAYRDAANPGFEAWIEVANDVRALVEAVLAIKDAAELGSDAVVDEVGQKLIDLLTLNYVRARWPKLYYWMEFARFSTEPTTIYGSGGTGSERFGSSLLALIRFLLAPVETLGRLAFAKDAQDRPHMATEADARKVSDATFLHLAGFLAFLGRSSREVGFDSLLGDEVAINALYGWDQPRFAITPDDLQPTAADTLSERMLSVQVRVPPHAYSGGAQIEGALRMSAAWVPADQGGPGLFMSLGGSAFRFALDGGGRWVTQAEARFDAPFGLQFGGAEKFRLTGPIGDGQMHATASFASRPMEPGKYGFRLSLGGDNGLQIGRIALTLTLTPDGLDTRISFHDCKLALDGSSFDDFIGSLLPKENTSVEFSFGTGYSTKDGFFTTGDVPLLSGRGQDAPPATTPTAPADPVARTAAAPPPPQAVISNGNGGGGIPIQIPIGKSLGPIRLHDALLELSRDSSGATPRTTLKTALSFSAQIGPVFARVDKIGVSFALEFPEDRSKANLHFANVDLGFVPPTSIALVVDAKKVKGGGFLFHDAAKHQYAGVMELEISGVLAVKAFGIITTRMPDGSKGYSLLIMITAETTSETGSLLNLPMGFRLTGIGGLLAIHRTASPEALRAGLKNRTLESILFPKDPVRNAPTIIAALDTVFPLQRGSYMVGLLVRLVWGVPKLITIDLALIIEWGVHERFIILGRISAILPRPDKDLLRLNLDSIGIFDFNEGTLEIDAALVDSRLLNKFVITGAAAVRARWNSPRSFALAVGGMNNNFTPPKNFPKLERVTLSLTTGDNPRLTCDAYIAMTANTVQLGAHAHLYAAAYGFSVEGEAGFDVLIRLLPFHFLAEFYAGMQLKKGSRNLFKVKVEGALEGPVPLAVRAKATFEVLWWDVSIRVNVTLFGGAKPAAPPGVNAFEQLRVALNDARSWSAEVPGSASRIVSLRERTDDGTLRAHPLGTLTVRQAVVPLNLGRDIEKFGESPLDGARRFAITKVAFDGGGQTTNPLRDDFAPSQFFEMSDEAKLASPSYEPMDAGVRVGATEITLGYGERVESDIVYETRVIDRAQGKPPETRKLGDYKLSMALMSLQALQGAAGRSVLRRGAQAEAAKADAPAPFATLKTVEWAAVGADLAPAPIGPGAASGPMTFVEASVLAKSAPQFQVVRAFEVLGVLR